MEEKFLEKAIKFFGIYIYLWHISCVLCQFSFIVFNLSSREEQLCIENWSLSFKTLNQKVVT